MIIKSGTLLTVNHERTGVFDAKAKADFDTNKEEFYPVILDQERLEGVTTQWVKGMDVPCRKSLCTIKERLA